jgi:hypothetical protein
MKFATLTIVMALALSGSPVCAQSQAPGSSAAKQDISDPSIKKPTSDEMKGLKNNSTGVTTGRAPAGSNSQEQLGGPPKSQQSGTGSGG